MKPPIAGGTIKKITCNHEDLLVDFLDWQENLWTITFKNIGGFKGVGAVGSEALELIEVESGSFFQEIVTFDPLEKGKQLLLCFRTRRQRDFDCGC